MELTAFPEAFAMGADYTFPLRVARSMGRCNMIYSTRHFEGVHDGTTRTGGAKRC